MILMVLMIMIMMRAVSCIGYDDNHGDFIDDHDDGQDCLALAHFLMMIMLI